MYDTSVMIESNSLIQRMYKNHLVARPVYVEEYDTLREPKIMVHEILEKKKYEVFRASKQKKKNTTKELTHFFKTN